MQIIENVDPSCRDCAETPSMEDVSDADALPRVTLELFSLLDGSPEEIIERLRKRRMREDSVPQARR